MLLTCMSGLALADAPASTSLLDIPLNNTLLISVLLLLCTWLGYRLVNSRLEILNIQAIDFHALADNAHDGIFIVQDEKLVYANQRAAEILGYANTELLRLKLIDIVHPEEAEQVLKIHQSRLRGEDVPKQYEAVFLNKHGNNVPVELTAAVTSWHGEIAGLVIIRDITDRKLIQQTLQDSEKRYRSLVENSPDAIVIIDAESSSIIEANEQTCELFKLSRQELFDTSIDLLSASNQKNRQQKPLAHYIERALHGMPLLFEHTFITNQNESVSCEVRLSRMPFPKRRLLRASITNISERKLYQTALMQSERRLFSFFEASFEMLLFHDNGIITDVNNQIEKLFGETRENAIGKHVLEYVAPESQELAKQNMAKAEEGPYELMAIHNDGHSFPVQIQAKSLVHNDKTTRVVSVVDISQLKETHSALLASKQEFQNILENLLDTYYQTDVNGRLTMVSASGEELLGYKPEDAIGLQMSSLYADPYDRQFFLDTLKKQGEVRGYEAAMQHKNGKIRWVSTNARFLYDDDGNVKGVEGITRDITQRREYELALSQAKNELEIKVERRTRQLKDKIAELEKIQQTLASSEHNFRILVENAVDTILLHDIKGQIIDVNQQACKSLGYSREELLKLNINDIDIGQNPISFKTIVEKLKTQDSYHLESTHLCKDGSHIPVEINLGMLNKGRTRLILAMVRDISHRHDASTPQDTVIKEAEITYSS